MSKQSNSAAVQQPNEKHESYEDSGIIVAFKVVIVAAIAISALLLIASMADSSVNYVPIALYILGSSVVCYFGVSIASDVHKIAYYTKKMAETKTNGEGTKPES